MRDRVAKYVCVTSGNTRKKSKKNPFFSLEHSQESGIPQPDRTQEFRRNGTLSVVRWDRSDTLRKKRKRGERPSFSFFSQGVGSRIKIKDPKALESFDQNNAKCKLKIPGELPQ